MRVWGKARGYGTSANQTAATHPPGVHGQTPQVESTQGSSMRGPSTRGQNTQGESTQGQSAQVGSKRGQSVQGQSTQDQSRTGQSGQGQSGQGQSTQGQSTQGQSIQGQSTQSESKQGQSTLARAANEPASSIQRAPTPAAEARAPSAPESGQQVPSGQIAQSTVTAHPQPAPARAVPVAGTHAAAHTGDIARVMICDDSVVIRGAVSRMLEEDQGIRVVCRASDGAAALRMLKRGQVDVLVLDIEMPEMDGLTALPLLLKIDPDLKIIMSSTLTTRGADVALQALRLGAADYLPKPSAAALAASTNFRDELIAKVKGLARLRRRTPETVLPPPAARKPPRAAPSARAVLLGIGSSTGGPQALFTLVQALGRRIGVPVVLTQHMPATFTPILAKHITALGELPCHEAIDGEPLRPDQIYLAPGDKHLLVQAGPTGLRAALSQTPAENFCRPSVDPMLRSAAVATGGKMLFVMLTGMGQDGLIGTHALIEAGGAALAQDEATSVVWGMPGAIARAGLCQAVVPLGALAGQIHSLLRSPS